MQGEFAALGERKHGLSSISFFILELIIKWDAADPLGSTVYFNNSMAATHLFSPAGTELCPQ